MDKVTGDGIPVSFSLTFITADKNRNTGGEIISIEKAQKCVGKRSGNVLYATPINIDAKKSVSRDPHHAENDTRNIFIPTSGQVRKVHVRLITKFNGKIVIP